MNKRGVIFILVIASFILILPNIHSDIISVNSGGDTEAIITPGADIEGFFAGGIASCAARTCSQLGYDCNNWSDGCGGTLACGTCSSGFTCTSGVCVSSGTTTTPSGGTTTGETSHALNIVISPKEIKLDNMVVERAEGVTITITNNEATSQTLQIRQSNLDKVVILGATSITLLPGETRKLDVTFVSLLPGNFVGTITIGGQNILVDLNVRTQRYLFDSNIIVLNKNYQIPVGSPLRTRVGLIPKGQDNERMDVTLNYAIKDYAGKVYLTQSETLLVTKAMDFDRNFQTGMLPIGNYTVSLELIYPNGVAPSSAHFTMTVRSVGGTIASILLFLITGIIIVSIMIVLVLIRINRRRY